jgi:hypothetical protein
LGIRNKKRRGISKSEMVVLMKVPFLKTPFE